MTDKHGISDEAAVEGHDLIANAENEERRLHGDDGTLGATEYPHERLAQKQGEGLGQTAPKDTSGAPSGGPTGQHTGGTAHKESTMDKVKEALHMKK